MRESSAYIAVLGLPSHVGHQGVVVAVAVVVAVVVAVTVAVVVVVAVVVTVAVAAVVVVAAIIVVVVVVVFVVLVIVVSRQPVWPSSPAHQSIFYQGVVVVGVGRSGRVGLLTKLFFTRVL